MALKDTLQTLLRRAAAGEPAAACTLPSGLKVWARTAPEGRQLVLTREGIQDPWGMKVEANTCGKHAGWAAFDIAEWTTPKGARCLTVTEIVPLVTTPDPSLERAKQSVLARVYEGKPLNANDREAVLALIASGFMHVTPEYDRHDKCPYRLTVSGVAALTGVVAA